MNISKKSIKFSFLTIYSLVFAFILLLASIFIMINRVMKIVIDKEIHQVIETNNTLNRISLKLTLTRDAMLMESMLADVYNTSQAKEKLDKLLFQMPGQHHFEFFVIKPNQDKTIPSYSTSSLLDENVIKILSSQPIIKNQWRVFDYKNKLLLCYLIPLYEADTGKQSAIVYGGFELNDNLGLYSELTNISGILNIAVVYESKLIGSLKSFDQVEMQTISEVVKNSYFAGIYNDFVFSSEVFPMQDDRELLIYSFSRAGSLFNLSSLLYQNLFIVFGVLGLIFLSFSLMFIKLITKPLNALVKYAQELIINHKTASYKAGFVYEINILAEHLKTSFNKIIETREQIRHISDNLADGFVYQASTGADSRQRVFYYISAGIEKILNLKPEEIYQNPSVLYSLIASEHLQSFITLEEKSFKENCSFKIETLFILPDKTKKYLMISSTPQINTEGKLVFDGIAIDITKQKEADKKLKESFKKLEKLNFIINHSPAYAFLWKKEKNWPVEYVSENVSSLLGYKAKDFLTGNIFFAHIIHPDDINRVNQEIEKNLEEGILEYTQEYRVIGKNGDVSWVDDRTWVSKNEHGEYYYFQGILLDITERKLSEEKQKKLTEQLHHSQKMDAIGRLAGGVAHDFNNILGAILASSELLKRKSFSSEKQIEFLDLIIKATQRASELTKKLLAFSRKGKKDFAVIDCLKIINDTVSLLTHTIDKKISINIENKAVVTTINGDSSLLQNALVNMGINSTHAMSDGGLLIFSLQNVFLNATYCESSPFDLIPGDYLQVSVRDTGEGMPPEVLARIYEPFFTTKEQGKGTGLGLPMVYGMVQEHYGAINAYSEFGKGTVFHLYFPVVTEDVKYQETSEEIITGSGTILIIDDEELIQITASEMLKFAGYNTLVAENGLIGVEIFAEKHNSIDLVILDMIMPVMDGREAFDKLFMIDSNVPVIISSGFAKEKDMEVLKTKGVVGFLNKPFRSSELTEIVAKSMRKS